MLSQYNFITELWRYLVQLFVSRDDLSIQLHNGVVELSCIAKLAVSRDDLSIQLYNEVVEIACTADCFTRAVVAYSVYSARRV